MSVSHFSFGISAVKSRSARSPGAGVVSPSYEPYSRRSGTCAVGPSSAMILRSAFSETRVRSTALTLRYPYLPLEEANASATSRINAFPSSGSSTLRRGASASPADRSRRIAGLSAWPAFLFLGRSAAMPPSRYALTRLRTAPMPAPSRSAACFRACRPAPVRSPWPSSPLG